MDVKVGLWRKLSTKELMLLICGVGEDSLSLLDCKEIQPIHSKGDQSWVFIGRTDAKAETPICWPPHVKSWFIGKDSDAGRDWGQEEKGTTEDEMAGWSHQLNGHEFGWTLGVGDGQGGLACCNSWGRKESDTTERLDWTELKVEQSIKGICEADVMYYSARFYNLLSSLLCCSPWGHKELDTTEQLNWTELNCPVYYNCHGHITFKNNFFQHLILPTYVFKVIHLVLNSVLVPSAAETNYSHLGCFTQGPLTVS